MNLENGDPDEDLSRSAVVLTLPANEDTSVASRETTRGQDLKITVFDSFDAVQSVWTEFEKQADGFAFQTFAWLKSWHEFVGAKSNLALCIALIESADGAPVMLLPLAVERRAFVSCLVWLGGGVSDYRAPLLAKDFSSFMDRHRFRALWREIRDRLPRHDAVILDSQPELIGTQRNPLLALAHTPHVTKAYFTELGPTLDAFLQAKRNTHWLRDERRKERRLREKGALVYRVANSAEDIDRMLSEMMTQKSRSYHELGVRDLFSEPGHREFFYHLSRRCLQDGFVHLSALIVNGEMKATHWGLVYRDRFYCLLPSYARDELTRYSPGNVLLRRMFEWSIARGVKIFDFTIGDEPYKDGWCDQELKMFDCIKATHLLGWFYVVPLSLGRAAKRMVLRFPRLRAPAHNVRVWFFRWRWRR